jgi:hypothetical protein
MKRKVTIVYFFLVLFIIGIPNVFASSSVVISEGKAGGYQYTVIKEQNNFSWKIGHQENIFVIKESKDNREVLERFMHAVSDLKVQLFELVISISYFVIICIITLILYKKNKQILKGNGAIIVLFAGIAIWNVFLNSMDLSTLFMDAKFYYSMLIN